MIKRLRANVRDSLSSYPILKSFLRMFIDKRYFYHNLQGIFTNHIFREYLKKLELLFYRKRVNLYKNSQYILLDGKEKLIDNGIIESPIKLEAKIADDIKDYLRNKLCHDPEIKNSSYFKVSDAKGRVVFDLDPAQVLAKSSAGDWSDDKSSLTLSPEEAKQFTITLLPKN